MINELSPRVFVAGPLTIGDQAVNVRMAVDAADRLIAIGCLPYIPHLTHFWHMVSPKDYEVWMALSTGWLMSCQALYRVDGPSAGADREVNAALRIGIPVFMSMDEVVKWRSSWNVGSS